MLGMIAYCLIGFLVGLILIDNAEKDSDKSMLCIGASLMLLVWPIYLVYWIYDMFND